jgi:SAM-dependent methyltransferase
MLLAARKWLAPPALRLVCADVLSLPLATPCFERIVCFCCFPHFRDQQLALRSLRQALVHGGRLYVIHEEGSEAVNMRHCHIGGPVGHDLLPSGELLAAMLQASGFGSVTIEDRQDLFWAEAVKV